MRDTSKHREVTLYAATLGGGAYPGCSECEEPWPCEVARLTERVTVLEAAVEKLKSPVSHAKRHSPYDCSVRRGDPSDFS
jgi:hypothetical protein